MSTPVTRFAQWYAEAHSTPSITEPTAMTLATVAEGGQPRARVVLLKDFDERGFTFYTNHHGAKGKELLAHPQASLLFYWMPLTRQVRIEGTVETVSDAEADVYFASRDRGRQVGAWASLQSEPLDAYDTLQKRVAEFETKFAGGPIPRPPHWGGFRLVPQSFEFWSEGPYRLHQRDIYTRDASGEWQLSHLYP